MISPDQLRIALLEQQQKRRPLGWLLAELGFADEAGVQDVVAEQLACQRFDPVQHRPSPQALALLAEEEARRQYLLPLAVDAATQTFLLAMAQPFDPHARALCDSICPGGMRCEVLLAGAGEIEQAISQHYPSRLDIDTLLDECGSKPTGRRRRTANLPPCAWWRRCLQMPCARGLDLHFSPELTCSRIRYRIDGMLTIRLLHLALWPMLAGRLKILAGMNAENRLARRSFQPESARPVVDFRVSVSRPYMAKILFCAF